MFRKLYRYFPLTRLNCSVQEYNPVSYLKDKVEQVRSLGLLVEAEPVGGIVQEDDLGRELVHPRPALIAPHFVHASLHIQKRAQLMNTLICPGSKSNIKLGAEPERISRACP